MHNASFGDHMASWDRLVKTVAGNASELSHLQRTRDALARAQREAEEARQRQAAARAAAQQATRDLEAAMARAHEAATRLRSGIRGRYGRTSIKLVEFGMRPVRPARKRAEAPAQGGALPQRVPDAQPLATRPEPVRVTSSMPAGRPSAMGRRSPSHFGHPAPEHGDASQWGAAPQRPLLPARAAGWDEEPNRRLVSAPQARSSGLRSYTQLSKEES